MIPLNHLTVLLSGLSGWYFTLTEAEYSSIEEPVRVSSQQLFIFLCFKYAFELLDDARLLLFLIIYCWYYYHHALE